MLAARSRRVMATISPDRVGGDADAGALHRRRRAAVRARWPILDARRADGRRNRRILRAAAGAKFAEVLRALLVQHAMAEAAGRDPPPARYAEVSQRDGARYDSRHGFDADPLASLLSDPRLAGIARRLVPALVRVLGADAECVALGQIVGIGYGWDALDDDDDEQRWHTDGRGCADTDALTLFIPLVDCTAENGATQFWLGSQESSEAPDESQPTTTLELPAGSAVASLISALAPRPSQPDGDGSSGLVRDHRPPDPSRRRPQGAAEPRHGLGVALLAGPRGAAAGEPLPAGAAVEARAGRVDSTVAHISAQMRWTPHLIPNTHTRKRPPTHDHPYSKECLTGGAAPRPSSPCAPSLPPSPRPPSSCSRGFRAGRRERLPDPLRLVLRERARSRRRAASCTSPSPSPRRRASRRGAPGSLAARRVEREADEARLPPPELRRPGLREVGAVGAARPGAQPARAGARALEPRPGAPPRAPPRARRASVRLPLALLVERVPRSLVNDAASRGGSRGAGFGDGDDLAKRRGSWKRGRVVLECTAAAVGSLRSSDADASVASGASILRSPRAHPHQSAGCKPAQSPEVEELTWTDDVRIIACRARKNRSLSPTMPPATSAARFRSASGPASRSQALSGGVFGACCSLAINYALVEVSLSPLFAVAFGVLFLATGAMVAYQVALEPATAGGRACCSFSPRFSPCRARSASCSSATGRAGCRAGPKVPLYGQLGVSVSFSVHFSALDLIGRLHEVLFDSSAARAIIRTPWQAKLLAVTASFTGLMYGLIFGVMDVEDVHGGRAARRLPPRIARVHAGRRRRRRARRHRRAAPRLLQRRGRRRAALRPKSGRRPMKLCMKRTMR